jgi:hypothetical protein
VWDGSTGCDDKDAAVVCAPMTREVCSTPDAAAYSSMSTDSIDIESMDATVCFVESDPHPAFSEGFRQRKRGKGEEEDAADLVQAVQGDAPQ